MGEVSVERFHAIYTCLLDYTQIPVARCKTTNSDMHSRMAVCGRALLSI
jgi:hypothetical protein